MTLVKSWAVVFWVCGVLVVNGNKPRPDDKPTMVQLRSFRGKSRNMDLAEHISGDYKAVGRCLLEDDSGARVSIIVNNENGKIKNINDGIFEEWLKGSGKRPVTWATILDCLREARLNELIREIQEGLEGVVEDDTGARVPIVADNENGKIKNTMASTGGADKGGDGEKDVYVEKEQQLFAYLQDIGDWDSLCTNLEVSKAVMANLRIDNQKPHLKKKECLTSYFGSGRATWNKVVQAVAAYPFFKKGLACKIAETFMGMERNYCLDHYLSKDEL